MKKIAFLLPVLVLTLTGCSTVTSSQLQADLEATLSAVLSQAPQPTNAKKDLFAYYLPRDVGRYESSSTGNVFTYQGIKFVMNLSVSNIVNDQYYQGTSNMGIEVSEAYQVASTSGTMEDGEGQTQAYTCSIYHLETTYMVTCKTPYVEFYGVGSEIETVALSGQMMSIARSVVVDKEEVLAAYSSKETVQYTKQALQLFEVVVPESGRVEEIMDNKNEVVQQEATASPEVSEGEEGDSDVTPVPEDDIFVEGASSNH